jgi:hypothetical protein
MTGSQVKNAVGLVLTFVSTTCAAIFPILQPLPAPFNRYAFYVSLVGVLAGQILSSFNQSLNTNHISIPADSAALLPAKTRTALGIDDQLKG